MAEFNQTKSFDVCLKEGQVQEKKLAEIFETKKIEVKFDKKVSKTGNIVVEIESWSRPSGIVTTEADYWAFILAETGMVILIETEKLREKIKGKSYVRGGDANSSKLIIISVSELIK